MTERQQQWPIAVSSLWILAAIFGRTSAKLPSQDSNEFFGPNADIVTASIIQFRVPCLLNGACEPSLNHSIIYSNMVTAHSKPTEIQLHIPHSRIRNLLPDAEYTLVTYVKYKNETIRKEMTFWSCPKQIPKLTSRWTAKAGPGWIDLRWPLVRDVRCKSKIIYAVQYTSESPAANNFTPIKTYGLITASDGTSIVRSWHPCAAWDQEFCLLLTDFVKPGRNHTVLMLPIRYDPNVLMNVSLHESKHGKEVNEILVYADPTVTGRYTFGQADAEKLCRPEISQISNYNASEGRSDQPVKVPMWMILLAVFLLISAFSVLIVTWIYKKSKSNKALLLDEHPATSSPAVCLEDANNRERASHVYDDCMTTVQPGTEHKHPGHSERFQFMKSSLPKRIAVQAASRVDATNKNGMTSDCNHYVTMNSQPIYDDAQGVVRNVPETSYSNVPQNVRESCLYMEPTSPIYEEAKLVMERASKASAAYNEVYSHSPEGPWRSW